jgi:hypothetical protein
LLVFLAPTTTRKNLSIGFHLLLFTTIRISELATTMSADFSSQNPTVARRMSFLFLLPSPFVTNLSPYKCRGVGVPNWSQQTFGYRKPLGRPRRRWKENIKTDLEELGWAMDWVDLAHYRDRWRALVNAVMNLWVP